MLREQILAEPLNLTSLLIQFLLFMSGFRWKPAYFRTFISTEGKSEINLKTKPDFVILACFIRCFGSSWMENNVADYPSPQSGSL